MRLTQSELKINCVYIHTCRAILCLYMCKFIMILGVLVREHHEVDNGFYWTNLLV